MYAKLICLHFNSSCNVLWVCIKRKTCPSRLTWTSIKVACMYFFVSSRTRLPTSRRCRIIARPCPFLWTIVTCYCTSVPPSPVTPPTINCSMNLKKPNNCSTCNNIIVHCLALLLYLLKTHLSTFEHMFCLWTQYVNCVLKHITSNQLPSYCKCSN